MELASPVKALPGIGPSAERLLAKLNIRSIRDLLFFVPSGYEDFTKLVTVDRAPAGASVSLYGRVSNIATRKSKRNSRLYITEGIFQDSSGAVPIIWFSRFVRARFPQNEMVTLSGRITLQHSKRQIVNPLWEPASDKLFVAGQLLPLYPLTAGLSQWQLRRWAKSAIELVEQLEEPLSSLLLKKLKLPTLKQALRMLHQPRSSADVEVAQNRLAFDELILRCLAGLTLLAKRRQEQAPQITISKKEREGLEKAVPFVLHKEQREALKEVLDDMEKPYPMQRLLQGEVGSGKTAVAALAAFSSAKVGWQTLYIVPTELLARQQYDVLEKWFSRLGVSVALLTAKRTEKNGKSISRSVLESELASGAVSMVVGTQSLFNTRVRFKKLGLVIVDEQHRFGVQQRFLVQRKGGAFTPHLLSMTATPIPRTMRLVYYADLALSTIHEAALGTRKVLTALVRPSERIEVERRLRKRVIAGEQAYIVCPVVNPSSQIEARAASAEYQRLAQQVFPDVSVGYVQGKMKDGEKENALLRFRSGKTRILVATSVVEVGVDVTNASIMIIESAERFGLAQLHQLRGRVGRSGKDAYCLLFTGSTDEVVLERLRFFAKTKNAFVLAEHDLALRGPGDWFGTEQSGFPDMRFASLQNEELRETAERSAAELLEQDPELSQVPELRRQVQELLKKATLPS
ncbi:MAG: ATP-dependent DNA helicase RecG [Patescibacteria group bacterium]|jgi:ATP-dependent DNA helicase RecG